MTFLLFFYYYCTLVLGDCCLLLLFVNNKTLNECVKNAFGMRFVSQIRSMLLLLCYWLRAFRHWKYQTFNLPVLDILYFVLCLFSQLYSVGRKVIFFSPPDVEKQKKNMWNKSPLSINEHWPDEIHIYVCISTQTYHAWYRIDQPTNNKKPYCHTRFVSKW